MLRIHGERLEALVGRTYGCQFSVVAVLPLEPGRREEERSVVLSLQGDRFVISAGELVALLESGLVTANVNPVISRGES